MPDYKAAYLTLFNRVSDIVNALQAVQAECEELIISDEADSSEEPPLSEEETHFFQKLV